MSSAPASQGRWACIFSAVALCGVILFFGALRLTMVPGARELLPSRADAFAVGQRTAHVGTHCRQLLHTSDKRSAVAGVGFCGFKKAAVWDRPQRREGSQSNRLLPASRARPRTHTVPTQSTYLATGGLNRRRRVWSHQPKLQAPPQQVHPQQVPPLQS